MSGRIERVECKVTPDLGVPDADQRRPESELTNASNRMKRMRKKSRATWELNSSSSLTIAAPTRLLDARHAGSVVFGMIAGLEQSNDAGMRPEVAG
jgi:hypothetical protein